MTLSFSRSFCVSLYSFFFNVAPPTDIYTLSLHDALPILLDDSRTFTCGAGESTQHYFSRLSAIELGFGAHRVGLPVRSEEHTSELQSLAYLVCRLLLEKKKKNKQYNLLKTIPPYNTTKTS